MKYSPELCLFFAPTINSYKRYQPKLGADPHGGRRQSDHGIPGRGTRRFIPSGEPDARRRCQSVPRLRRHAGRRPVVEKLDCGEEYQGNAYVDPKLARLPHSLRDATDLFATSAPGEGRLWNNVVDFLHPPRPPGESLRQCRHRLGKAALLRADLMEREEPAWSWRGAVWGRLKIRSCGVAFLRTRRDGAGIGGTSIDRRRPDAAPGSLVRRIDWVIQWLVSRVAADGESCSRMKRAGLP